MELVIHRDKLESSTESQREKKKEGKERSAEKCFKESMKENQGKVYAGNVGMLKGKRI